MEIFLVIFILIGIAAFCSIFAEDKWPKVANELSLEYKSFFQKSIKGRIDKFHVSIVQQKNYIDICISGESIRRSIKLTREGFLSGVLGGQDIEIGCRNFDSKTFVTSYASNSEAEVAALLDSKTRAIVSRIVAGAEAKVSNGNITYNKTNSINDVPDIVKGMLLLASRLEIKTRDIPARLARNAIEDPVSSVRLRNLTLLQENYRKSDEAKNASIKLINDSYDSISLAAAIFSGEKGMEVVRKFALSDEFNIDIRIKAIMHLTVNVDFDERIDIATELLKERDSRLLNVAIRLLGRSKHHPSLSTIINLLKTTSNDSTRIEIVKAIESIGDRSAEPVLIKLLEDHSDRVKTASIEALATLGSVKAVEPLLEFTKRRGFKYPARKAIESIQAQLGDVESGQLSLAQVEDPDGALSLAGDTEKAGGLSFDSSESS